MPESWIPWAAGLLGLAVGSFLNVCTFRWPLDQSVVRPRSRCPRCETPIAPWDNVPVLGWLLLRGRCRHCREPISIQYPLVELTTGLLWAGAVWLHGPDWEALRGALFLTMLLGIALSDARFYVIPDQFSLGGAALGLALAFLPGGLDIGDAALGAAVGFGGFWLVGVGGTWLVRKLNPERLEGALQEHDEQRADEVVRARVAKLRAGPVRGFLVVLAVVAAAAGAVVRGPGGLLAVGAVALAMVAVILAWAEAFEDPTFALPVEGGEEAVPEPEEASALGGGDVRMMALVGAFVGIQGVVLSILGGSVLGLLAAIPLTLAFRQLIPLGIFLAFAAGGAWAAGDAVVSWYLGLVGL